jgi:hypothetical protein
MAWLYAGFYAFSGNHGASIVFLSLTVNTILLPFYAIADRLKNNDRNEKEKMADELENISNYIGAEKYYYIREIYRRHGYHPLKALRVAVGFLIQVPFFVAAYQFLGDYGNFSGVGFLFIQDLSRPDALLKGINILPLVMTGINLISAFVFARALDKSGKLQLYGLSVLFLLLLYDSPAALVLYWTTSNLFSLGKSWFLSRNKRDTLHPATKVLASEKIRELLASPLSERIASVSFVPAVYVASMAYNFIEQKRSLTISSSILGVLFVFSVLRFSVLSKKAASKRIILGCSIVITILLFGPICDAFHSLSAIDSVESAIFLSIILEIIGITILYLAVLPHFSLLPNLPVLLTSLFLNLWSIGYVADLIGYTASMLLITIISGQLCCGYDFLPHEKKPLLKIMAGILLLVLSVFILTPLRFVLTTPDEYIIPIKDFLPHLTVYTLLITASLFVIFWFLIKTKMLVAYLGLFFVVIYFVYSSIPFEIGQIKDFMLENPEKLNISFSLRMAETLVIASLFFLGYYFMVKKRGIVRSFRPIVVISIILPAFLSIQVGRFFFDNYQKITRVEVQKRYEGGNQLTVSSNGRNIIVLFLDAFSSQILPDLFEKKPQLLHELDGFVWFKDTITAGSWTWNGTPGIWGGHDYTPDKLIDNNGLIQPEYFYGAYKIMPTEMLRRGFKVNYYNQHIYTELIGTVLDENFKSFKLGSRAKDLDLLSRQTYLTVLPRVTLFIGLPFLMKSKIYDDGKWRSTLLARGDDSSFFERRTDWEALKTLKEYSSEPLGDVFTFFMSLSTHGPFFLDWNGEFSVRNRQAYWDYDGELIASYYALKSIADLIDKLKGDGLYEKTKIILVSDHGNLGVPKTQTRDLRNIISTLPEDHAKWFDALLMVKEFDSSGPLRTDTRFMSNADVLSFVMGKGDQISGGRRLIHTSQYGHNKGKIMISMESSLSTDSWKIIRNDVTADCKPTVPGCAE